MLTEHRRKSNFSIPIYLAIVLSIVATTAATSQQAEPSLRFQHAVFGPSRGILFRNPQGIEFDRTRGEIYVTDSGNYKISVFDLTGRHIFSIPYKATEPRTNQVVVTEPRDIAVDSEGTMYITDIISGVINVRDMRGESIGKIDLSKKLNLNDAKVIPEYLHLDSKGNLYVTTTGDIHEVIVLDRHWDVVRRIEGEGEGFTFLTGVWVDEEGKVYVTDANEIPCIQVFDREGKYLFGFGDKDIGDENFSHPHGIATTANGDIWIVDSIRQVVKHFDREGRYIDMLGGFGVNAGDLLYPNGLTGDGLEKLFVLERVGSRYQYFLVGTPEGMPADETNKLDK
jgi:DNA-binding beta-propeller fold protein YncE